MISYAQNFEDVILERFFKGQKTGFYVDIGAADPVKDSVTKHFYDKKWRGINIEPSPVLFKKLVQERKRDINLNFIISNQESLNAFFDIPNSGLSSIYQDCASSALEKEGQKDYDGCALNSFEKILIESKRLTSILEQYANNIKIDFLKIDVEGTEREVIESNNWNVFRPKVLIIEATVPNSPITNFESWDQLLIQSDYIFVYFDGLNRFYLRNDLFKYKEVFSYPPCVFDEFIQYSEVKKQLQLSVLLSQQQELQSQYQELHLQNMDLILQNQRLFNQVNSILNSYSWRVLTPVRWFFSVFKYLVQLAIFFISRICRFKKNIISIIKIQMQSKQERTQAKGQTHPLAYNLSHNAKKMYLDLQKAFDQNYPKSDKSKV